MIERFISSALAYNIGVPIVNNRTTYNSFNAYAIDLINYIVLISGSLAGLVIIYGAFKYTTSAGDESKIKESKEIIVGALVGLALLLLIKVLVPILGIK